jgi:DNA repair protein RadC
MQFDSPDALTNSPPGCSMMQATEGNRRGLTHKFQMRATKVSNRAITLKALALTDMGYLKTQLRQYSLQEQREVQINIKATTKYFTETSMILRDRPIPDQNPSAETPDIDLTQQDLGIDRYRYAKIARPSALRVKDLAASERPRERLLEQGVSTLSNAELLALLLGTGNGALGLSSLDLGQVIVSQLCQSGETLERSMQQLSAQRLMQVAGVGEAKATTIMAAIELGRRVWSASPRLGTVIDAPELAAQAFSDDLMHQPEERFAVLLLDTKHRLIGKHLVSIGTATETYAVPREVFREAIRMAAPRIILGHNHPSGDTMPSPDDLDLTRQLIQAGELLKVTVLDHLILGNGSFHSIRQSTSCWYEGV